MSEYTVTTHLGKDEWQIFNQARDHEFICDTVENNAGPNPVEYLCGSVNSCITMSAGMIAKVHQLDIKNFKIENIATTQKLEHGKSIVSKMGLNISFDSQMSKKEKEDFVAHTLHVSTVYQTVKQVVEMNVTIK